MGRPPCCDKSNVKRGIWTADEDAKILAYVSKFGIGNWTMVPKKAGLNRCGKSCRLRWTNYLRPDLKHDGFTPQEEDNIINLHKAIGSRWSLIAKHLPGRTDNDVKNYWNTKLRKKLTTLGIDPVTHKPFSKILSDYDDINTFPSNITPVRSLNRDSNNTTHNSSLPISELTAVTEPRMEQFQDSFVTSHNSWSFQTKFLDKTQQKIRPVLFNDVTPASSSSCSSYTVNQILNPPFQVVPKSPFLWSDFLNGEPTISTDDMIQRKQEMSQYKFSSAIGSYDYDPPTNIEGEIKNYSEASSSPAKSFVDALLDQDSQIQSEFPQLLNESFEF